MKQTVKISCEYLGKKSVIEFMQGGIDIVYRVGKMQKFDSLTSIEVNEGKISFHGLYYGSLLKKVSVPYNSLNDIFNTFKVRKLTTSKDHGAMYKDSSLTTLKVASKGEQIFDTWLNKRADKVRKYTKRTA